jgi:hypothetical protein
MALSSLTGARARLVAIALGLACVPAAAQDAVKARKDFVDSANIACLALNLAKHSKVRCWLAFRGGKPALVLSFEDNSKAQQIAPMILGMIGEQLCTAVRAERNGAAFVLADATNKPTSFYSCEQKTFLAWTDGDDKPAQ